MPQCHQAVLADTAGALWDYCPTFMHFLWALQKPHVFLLVFFGMVLWCMKYMDTPYHKMLSLSTRFLIPKAEVPAVVVPPTCQKMLRKLELKAWKNFTQLHGIMVISCWVYRIWIHHLHILSCWGTQLHILSWGVEDEWYWGASTPKASIELDFTSIPFKTHDFFLVADNTPGSRRSAHLATNASDLHQL